MLIAMMETTMLNAVGMEVIVAVMMSTHNIANIANVWIQLQITWSPTLRTKLGALYAIIP